MEWTAATLYPLIIDKPYTSFESLLREEQNVYSQHVPQRILEDLNVEIRVKVKK